MLKECSFDEVNVAASVGRVKQLFEFRGLRSKESERVLSPSKSRKNANQWVFTICTSFPAPTRGSRDLKMWPIVAARARC